MAATTRLAAFSTAAGILAGNLERPAFDATAEIVDRNFNAAHHIGAQRCVWT
jgi:hypothetical protein